MINSKKKGFTIVELVIVIAVIAVLAAVLIPTFSNLVKKANMSADQQAVRQMNTALAIETRAEDIEGAVALLDKAGYNAFESLSPVSKGYNFYWVASNNTIVLVDENLKVVFPANLEGEDLSDDIDKGEAYNLKKGFADATPENSDDFREALSKGQSVVLNANVDLQLENIRVGKGEQVELDLGGNTITVGYQNSGADTRHKYAIDNYGTLVIKNGTIEARGVQNFGTLTIEDGAVIRALDSNGGACVWNENGKLIINGGDFYAPASNSDISGASLVANTNGEVIINGGTFNTDSNVYAINNYSGKLTINNMTLNAKRGGVAISTGEAVINNCTVINNVSNSGYALYVNNATVEVNGGSFTNANPSGPAICLENATKVNFNNLFELVDGKIYKMK